MDMPEASGLRYIAIFLWSTITKVELTIAVYSSLWLGEKPHIHTWLLTGPYQT